jgi:Protein of unknown function (DUF2568)
MSTVLRAGNSVLRFVLELAALAILGVWGWHAGASTLLRLALAVGIPALAAAGWAQLVAPRARWFLGAWGRLLVEALVFGGAAGALVGLQGLVPGGAFAALAALNTLLVHGWRQDLHARTDATGRSG